MIFFDYLKGSDREDRLGPERACAQGWITLEAMKRGYRPDHHVGLCGWSLAAFLQWSRDDSGRTAVYSVCFFYILPVPILWLIMAGETYWSSSSSVLCPWDVPIM